MADITPLIAEQYTPETTSSATLVADTGSGTFCETAALANGVDYLVIARACGGGEDDAERPWVSCLFGDSSDPQGSFIHEVALGLGEGRGNSNVWDSNQGQCPCIITGDGSSTLFWSFASRTGGNVFIGSMVIVAVPLTELTEDTDYFVDQDIDGTLDDTSNIGSTATSIGGTATFNLPSPTQDYILLAGVNGRQDGANSDADAMQCYIEVDGSQHGPTWTFEWEDNDDRRDFFWAYPLNLTSGNHTFEIFGQNRDTSNTMRFRRHRIILLREDAFVQVVKATSGTGVGSSPFSNTSFSSSNHFLQASITPGAANRYVLGIGLTNTANSGTNSTLVQLSNETDAVDFSEDAGEFQNDSGLDSGDDIIPTCLLSCEQLPASQKDYAVQYRVDGSTGTAGRNADNSGGVTDGSHLFLIELATPTAGASAMPILMHYYEG